MSAVVFPAPARVPPALVFGGLQTVLGLTWAVYAVFLPAVVTAAGLPRSVVPWVLVLDQLIFALSDPIAGLMSDRAAARARRIGPAVAWLSTGSAVAFALLPHTAWGASPALLATLLLVWAVGTAALRAPLAALLGRHLPGDDTARGAWVASGLALTGVVGGYLIPAIRDVSPLTAFGVVAAGSAAVAWLAVPAERWLGVGPHAAAAGAAAKASRESSAGEPGQTGPWLTGPVVLVLVVAVLMALGMQLHTSVTAPALLGKLPGPPRAPLFWAGACLAAGVLACLPGRAGARGLAPAAGAIGVLAMALFLGVDDPWVSTLTHLLSGLAWGCVLTALFARLFELGRPARRLGAWVGALFAVLALATAARLATVTLGWWGGLGAVPTGWVALACWALGALVLAALAVGASRPSD